jgi:DNA (cytosine-5)-methyltransferase 1
MWVEMVRIIREVQPRIVFVENSPMLTSRGLGRVLGDLAEMGFNAEWGVLGARDVGAPHKRERIWVVAYAANQGLHQRRRFNGFGKGMREFRGDVRDGVPSVSKEEENFLANSCSKGLPLTRQKQNGKNREQSRGMSTSSCWWAVEPDVGRVANGMAFRADRLKAIGNGQVPLSAAEAFRQLSQRAGLTYERSNST